MCVSESRCVKGQGVWVRGTWGKGVKKEGKEG